MTADVDVWMARGTDETVLWHGHPRMASALPAVVVGLLVGLVGVGIVLTDGQPASLLLVPLGAVVAAWGYLRVVNTEFVVTDRALYRKTGIRSRSVARIALRRVQNSAFRQGLFGSLFGYGTIDVDAAGGGSIRFDSVVDAAAVRSLVEREADGDEIPGSVPQWEAVLAEVRSVRATVESTTR
jgi:uncharacterized membrane protein YdbT with pleckstrin-like domain